MGIYTRIPKRKKSDQRRFHLSIACWLFLVFHGASAFAQSAVQIMGNYSYNLDFSARTAQLHADQISNTSSTHTTGTLRLELWATTSAYTGGGITGFRIATYQIGGSSNGTLGPGQYFSSVTGTVPIAVVPPTGTYFVSFLVTEYGTNCTSSDGFCIDTFGSFGNSLVIGGPPGSPPACTVTLSPTSLPAAGGTVTFRANCSNSPASYLWRINGSAQSVVSSVGAVNIPASSSPVVNYYQFAVIATNTYGSSPVASATLVEAGLTGTGAVPLKGGLSGNYYDPNHSGEGVNVEVLALADGSLALFFAWFTFDNLGHPYWLVGAQGFNNGATTVTVPAAFSYNGGFAGNFGASTTSPSWGYVTFTFPTCNNLTMTYGSQPGLPPGPPTGSGVLNWQRLTKIAGTTCP